MMNAEQCTNGWRPLHQATRLVGPYKPASKLHRTSPFIITQPESWYSFYRPTDWAGRVDPGGWLTRTEMVYTAGDSHPSHC